MSKELQPVSPLVPSSDGRLDRVQQTGENNVFIENHAEVHLHVETPIVNAADITGADWTAVQKFSKEYYQLLVTCENIMEQTYVTPLASRSLLKDKVPKEIFETCSTLSVDGRALLKNIPAIICHENTGYNGETDPDQMAIYGRILQINPMGKEHKVHFKILGMFPQKILCDYFYEYDLNMDCALTSLNWSEWTVHKINLFEAFTNSGIHGLPAPRQ